MNDDEDTSEFRKLILSLPPLRGATLKDEARTVLIMLVGEGRFYLCLWSTAITDLDKAAALLAPMGKVSRTTEAPAGRPLSVACHLNAQNIIEAASIVAQELGIPIKATMSKGTQFRMKVKYLD